MRQLTVDAQGQDKRLDKYILKQLPSLPMGMMQKYLRLKRIKLNGKPAKGDQRLNAGDVLSLYIDDDFFAQPRKVDALLSGFRPHLHIVYEDAQILLADKQPGLMVHPDAQEKLNTLLTHVRAYLYQKGEYDSMDPAAFSPAPCNRIDRFTGGLVIFAKTKAALDVLNRKIRDREIQKSYLAIVRGAPQPRAGRMENYILKPEGARRVSVVERAQPGAQPALTLYRTLESNRNMSLVECELITGRTHQIRAQFAHAGHPLLGDSQYGDRTFNQRFGRPFQALYAYRLTFDFQTPAGLLDYLQGESFAVQRVPFVSDFFPGRDLQRREDE